MKIIEKETSKEKIILQFLLFSDNYQKEIFENIKKHYKLFEHRFLKTTFEIVINYIEKYASVPGKDNLELLLNELREKETIANFETVQIVFEDLKKTASSKMNYIYALELTREYIFILRTKDLRKKIQEAEERNATEEIQELIEEYQRAETEKSNVIDVLNDIDKFRHIFEAQEESIFTIPGDLGIYTGGWQRGDLIAISAPAKRGKSYMLIQIAIWAARMNLNVLFVSLEMTEDQMMTRFYQNISGCLRPNKKNKQKKVVSFSKKKDGGIGIVLKEKNRVPGAYQHTKEELRKFKMFLKQGNLKMFCGGMQTVSGSDIEREIKKEMQDSSYIPDMVIVDYADIMRAEKRNNYRNEINDKWEALKKIAQNYKCVVATATHTNKKTFERDIKQSDQSEDYRKTNHVSCMFALNQKKDEKKNGLMRVEMLFSRHDDDSQHEGVVLAQDLDIANPCIVSCFLEKIDDSDRKMFLREDKTKKEKNNVYKTDFEAYNENEE